MQFSTEYDVNNQGIREQDEEGNQPLESLDVDSRGFVINKQGSLITGPSATQIISGMTGDVVYMCSFADPSKEIRDWHKLVFTDDGTDVKLYRWYPNGIKTLIGTISNGAGYNISSGQLEGFLAIASPGFTTRKYNGSLGTLGGISSLSYSTQPATRVSDADTNLTPADRWSYIYEHRSRLHGIDNDDRTLVHYTSMFQPEGWGNSGTSAAGKGNWLSIRPNSGDGDLVATVNVEGDSGDIRILFKQKGSYILSGNHHPGVAQDGLDPFDLDKRAAEGTLSPDSVISVGSDALYLGTSRRFLSFISTDKNVEREEETLSYAIQNTFLENCREKSLPYVRAVNYESKDQIWISYRNSFVDTELIPGSSSIKALYHLDGVNDESGNSLTLTATNSPTLTKGFNRLHRDAYNLDGTNQYLRRSASAGSNSSSVYTACSVRIWAKIDTLPTSGNYSYLFHEASASGTFGIRLFNDSGTQKVQAFTTDGSGTNTATYTATLTTGEWYEFVLTLDQSLSSEQLKLYVNAIEQATTTSTAALSTGSDGYSIGSLADGSGSYLDGQVDETVIYNTALSRSQISQFYNGVSRQNDMTLILDYGRQAWFADGTIKAEAYFYSGGELYSGQVDGSIYLEDYGTTRPDSVNSRREQKVVFPWDDGRFSISPKVKDLDKQITIGYLYIADVNQDGQIIVKLRYEDGTSNQIILDVTASTTTTWGDNWGTMIWTAKGLDNIQKIPITGLVGFGRTFQWEIYKWTDGLNFRFVRLGFDGEILGKSVI